MCPILLQNPFLALHNAGLLDCDISAIYAIYRVEVVFEANKNMLFSKIPIVLA